LQKELVSKRRTVRVYFYFFEKIKNKEKTQSSPPLLIGNVFFPEQDEFMFNVSRSKLIVGIREARNVVVGRFFLKLKFKQVRQWNLRDGDPP
jgi:hypothetical protein